MIVIFFGAPGVGKGTQASRVAARSGLPHVSTGDMLRAEVERGTTLGKEAEPIMRSGELVPDDLLVRMIESRLGEPDAASGVILDGFPRTRPQAEALDAMLERTGRGAGIVLVLEVPDDVIRERVLNRAKLEGRLDDTPEAFAERLRVYREKTAPVLDHYRSTGARVEVIDGDAEMDVVTARILAALGLGDNGKEVA